MNEAAIFAARASRTTLEPGDFDAARDRVILGRREASNVQLPDERRAVAVHGSGHAPVAALCDHSDPVAKVTILPAGQALGVTEQLPIDERHLYSESYLRDSLAVRLGGRATELVVFGEGSTGASNDLTSATDLATRMVREFGPSDAIGPVGYPSGGPMFLGGGDQVRTRPYAEETQRLIDKEAALWCARPRSERRNCSSTTVTSSSASPSSSSSRRPSTARPCTRSSEGPCPADVRRCFPRSSREGRTHPSDPLHARPADQLAALSVFCSPEPISTGTFTALAPS